MRLRIVFFCLSSIFCLNIAFCSLESLYRTLPEQSGEEKLSTYLKISEELLSQNLLDSAQVILQRALTDGSDLFPASKIELFNLQAKAFEKNYAFEEALSARISGLETATQNGLKNEEANSQLKIGNLFLLKNEDRQAFEYFEKALKSYENLNDEEGMAKANRALGLLILSPSGKKIEKDLAQAALYLGKAVELDAKNGNLDEAATEARALGIALGKEGLQAQSLEWLRLSLKLNRELKLQSEIAEDYLLITASFLQKGDFEEALINNQQALKIIKKTGDKIKESTAELNLTEVFFKTNELEKGKEHLTKAEAIISSLPNDENKINLLRRAADFYTSIEDFKNSYLIQNQLIATQNSIFEKEKNRATEELSAEYFSRLSAKEQAQKLALIESEKTALSRNKMLWIALLLLATAMAASLFYLNKTHQNNNLALQEKSEKIEEQHMILDAKKTSLEMINRQLLEEISEREELERSSFERDRFLATMTHRMGTPLNSIVGLTHLLMKENPSSEQREQLRTLQFAANSLVVFINDVLDFSKIEAGKLKPDNGEIRMRRVYHDFREQAELETSEKDLKLNFSYNNKIPQALEGDPTRLNQILTNLLTTSLKSTSSGEITVNFDVGEETSDHVMFFASVSDTGKPLPPDIVARIFGSPDQYYLLGKQNSVAFAMTMARRLIELQGGKFELFVNEHHGNLFRFWLPLKKIMVSLPFSKIQTTTLEERLSGNKILLVEDNQINQMVVARMLQNIGIQIITANNGLEALDQIKDHNFDLILMDIQMPEMDGYRATAAIRKMADPVKKSVPIIALTASAFLTNDEKANLFGMDDHVGKPFSPDELLDKIDKLLLRVRKQ